MRVRVTEWPCHDVGATALNTLSLRQIAVPNVLFIPLGRAATLTPSRVAI
jgi:hypothetical protein